MGTKKRVDMDASRAGLVLSLQRKTKKKDCKKATRSGSGLGEELTPSWAPVARAYHMATYPHTRRRQ